MKKALISPIEKVSFLSDWISDGKSWNFVESVIEKSYRVAQVEESGKEFPVAKPYFWVDCPDNIIANKFYYHSETKDFISVPEHKPYPLETPT
jgi:hypothetical protein